MKNREKFLTANERAEAFFEYCRDHKRCEGCVMREKYENTFECSSHWLDLEAEDEEPLPCPFCGAEIATHFDAFCWWMQCPCGYRSLQYKNKESAVAAHNRVARAALAAASGESEARVWCKHDPTRKCVDCEGCPDESEVRDV